MYTKRVALLSLHADPSTVVGAPQNGGVTIYVREFARALAALGHDVDVITRRTSDSQVDESLTNDFRLVRIPVGPPVELENDAIAEHLHEAVGAFERLASARAYDVISSHYWLSGFVGQQVASRRGIRHIHTLHSHGVAHKTRSELVSKRIDIERSLLRDAHVVALSSEHRELFAREYGVTPRNLAIIPAGVDLERFNPGPALAARRILGVRPDAVYVGYVGRLAPAKGIDELISAFALLRAKGSHARLLVAGGAKKNSRVDTLRALASRFGAAQHVDFLGQIPNARIADVFRASDVVAIPSHYEAFGLVALEARACGTPVVASDVGGLRELVRPESGGARVPASDLIAWASELQRATEKEELARRKQLAQLAGVGAYSWPQIATRILAFAGMTGAEVA